MREKVDLRKAFNQSLLFEKWKDIPELDGFYQISTCGRVKSIERYVPRLWKGQKLGYLLVMGRILKPCKAGRRMEYLHVTLHANNEQKKCSIHRLVAAAWIKNPLNKPCVNHKDFDTTNNHVSNLEWCTYIENAHHSMNNGRLIRTINK